MSFQFGIESEFLLLEKDSARPLWHSDLSFEKLNVLLESIPLDGLPELKGLELESPHRKLMPFVVEGYSLPDANWVVRDILPKGIEIRTPVCSSLKSCLETYGTLASRLEMTLSENGLSAAALSHHPVATDFKGPLNKKRHDWWLWAMEVMTTYGPDTNVSLPRELRDEIDPQRLLARINHYGPAMTAFTVASPFRAGGLWMVRGKPGKSLRTFRRSVVAPPIETHPDEDGRLEFKLYDMTRSIEDLENGFLLFLALVLDRKLSGEASTPARIYDLGAVAVDGFDACDIVPRAAELLEAAERTLPKLGFDTTPLKGFARRLESRRTPADDMIDLYRDSGNSLEAVLKSLRIGSDGS